MSKELYVGNLSFAATEDDIRNLFSVSGTVVNLHLIKDPVSGLSKGCGYVKMANEKQAKAAINDLDGARLIDRIITVSIARPQKQAPPAVGKKTTPARPSGKKVQTADRRKNLVKR
jgi:RNA recognition motif-containing protein